MSLAEFITIAGTIIVPLLIFAAWQATKFTDLKNKTESNKLELTGTLRLMMSDERVEREKRFGQIQKEVQSNRHEIKNIATRVSILEGREKDRRKA